MPASNPMTVRLMELLADGEWHDKELVLLEIAKQLLPGQAYRATEQARVYGLRGVQGDELQARPRTRQRSEEFLVASGRRREAMLSINRNRRIEQRPKVEGSGKEIRLLPPKKLGPPKGSRFIDGKLVRPEPPSA